MFDSAHVFGYVFSLLLNTQTHPFKSELEYDYWRQTHTIKHVQELVHKKKRIKTDDLIDQKNIKSFDHAADVRLMRILSGAGIIAVFHHKERVLIIIHSPVKYEEVCKILSEHRTVHIKHIYYKTRQNEINCHLKLSI